MERDSYVYGVGRVVVKAALVEHLLHELVRVVMEGEDEAVVDKALKGGFRQVATKFKAAAPSHLEDEELLDRLNRLLDSAVKRLAERDEFAHSTWILDPNAPPGLDTRLHIRSRKEWYVGGPGFRVSRRQPRASVGEAHHAHERGHRQQRIRGRAAAPTMTMRAARAEVA